MLFRPATMPRHYDDQLGRHAAILPNTNAVAFHFIHQVSLLSFLYRHHASLHLIALSASGARTIDVRQNSALRYHDSSKHASSGSSARSYFLTRKAGQITAVIRRQLQRLSIPARVDIFLFEEESLVISFHRDRVSSMVIFSSIFACSILVHIKVRKPPQAYTKMQVLAEIC